MNQALLSGIASKAYDKLLKAAESKQPIAVTGLPDTMAAYIASKLCADTGKKLAVPPSLRIMPSETLFNALKSLLGAENVKFIK